MFVVPHLIIPSNFVYQCRHLLVFRVCGEKRSCIDFKNKKKSSRDVYSYESYGYGTRGTKPSSVGLT